MSVFQFIERHASSPIQYVSNRRMAVVETCTHAVPAIISERGIGVIRVVAEHTCRISSAQTPAGRARSEYWQERRKLIALAAKMNAEAAHA